MTQAMTGGGTQRAKAKQAVVLNVSVRRGECLCVKQKWK